MSCYNIVQCSKVQQSSKGLSNIITHSWSSSYYNNWPVSYEAMRSSQRVICAGHQVNSPGEVIWWLHEVIWPTCSNIHRIAFHLQDNSKQWSHLTMLPKILLKFAWNDGHSFSPEHPWRREKAGWGSSIQMSEMRDWQFAGGGKLRNSLSKHYQSCQRIKLEGYLIESQQTLNEGNFSRHFWHDETFQNSSKENVDFSSAYSYFHFSFSIFPFL